MLRNLAPIVVFASLVVAGQTSQPVKLVTAVKTNMAYDDAKPILDVLRDHLPDELPGQIEGKNAGQSRARLACVGVSPRRRDSCTT